MMHKDIPRENNQEQLGPEILEVRQGQIGEILRNFREQILQMTVISRPDIKHFMERPMVLVNETAPDYFL